MLLAVAENDDAHVAAGLDISYCRVDIGHRGCPAVVERGQHVARLETGQRGRRARKNRNDWHASRVDIAGRLGQPEAPEAPGSQHAAANRLGAGKAIGKLPKQVSPALEEGWTWWRIESTRDRRQARPPIDKQLATADLKFTIPERTASMQPRQNPAIRV